MLRHINPSGILFYQGVITSIVVAFITFLVLWKYKKRCLPEAGKDALFSFLLIYSFMFTVPTTVDRAYSIKMLDHIGQAKDGLSKNEIQQWFTDDFLLHGGVDKRLDEQAVSHTIENVDGQYKLTPWGQFLNTTFKWARTIFACKN